MLVGHFAVAFIGKRIEPRLSLGALTLASMFADILWPIFSIAGIEYVAGGSGAAGHSPSDIALSHSLVMVAVWAALFAGAYFLWSHYRHRERYSRALWVLFAAVLSHWLLDSTSHKHALAPGAEVGVKPANVGWVIGVDADGAVRHNLRDETGAYANITSVNQFDGHLLLGSIYDEVSRPDCNIVDFRRKHVERVGSKPLQRS